MNGTFNSLVWWNSLRHSGLLLDRKRLAELYPVDSPAIPRELAESLRQTLELGHSRTKGSSLELVDFVLSEVCGFREGWKKGPQVDVSWSRRDREGNTIRPERLWTGPHGSILPVFIDKESKTLGLGKGRRVVSRVLRWMRSGSEKLAVLTNGRQWRLLHAGLDYDAWCESDSDLWFEDGAPSPQLHALVSLLAPQVWKPAKDGGKAPLLHAVEESRKGQADLSSSLGERVRIAVEKLIDAHQCAIDHHGGDISPAELYRGAVRVVMRLVVVLFAESRGLLPVDNAIYHASYGLRGLQSDLEKLKRTQLLTSSQSAWPRLLALFRLVHDGSAHPDLPVRGYGGELFQPGSLESADGLRRAVWIFENACFKEDAHGVSDAVVSSILEHLTRTMERIRSGRGTIYVPVPVDFSDLSSEYIGILYEGLLDYELKSVPENDAVIILPIGNRPAMPLSRLECMSDSQLTELLAKFAKDSKAKASNGDEEESDEHEDDEHENDEPEEDIIDEIDDPEANLDGEEETTIGDAAIAGLGQRVTTFLHRMVDVGKLAAKPRGRMTPEKEAAYRSVVAKYAVAFARDVHYPGKRYLVRWGGTRKGSGSFYTRPGLSVPLIHRTLAPLAYVPPQNPDGSENLDAVLSEWTPERPEKILALKVCDIACGSGTFPVGALRYLTEALFESVHFHRRIADHGDRSLVALLGASDSEDEGAERLEMEFIPCRSDEPNFEPRLKAVLKRHVVERCIYGVDFNPLAVELCRLSLWIETMDSTLPFSFLDHKVKHGNSLIGAWFDQFLHYPVMAWKNREGGDKSHANGVHFQKGERGKAYKTFVREQVTPDLLRLLEGRTLFSEDQLDQATSAHVSALTVLSRLHNLPVQNGAERARLYREELVGSTVQQSLKAAMDLWCACWFWPADGLEHAPLPTNFSTPSPQTRAVAETIAADHSFFHWELEFPDVFSGLGSGFDAILGNPPWDIAKPNSKEFFSNLDPLYRGLGSPEARQTELFAEALIEQAWLDYSERFVSWSNFVKCSGNPFGDPEQATAAGDSFTIVRGGANDALHATWRLARSRAGSFSDPAHPFRSQGGSDLNLYKLFVEQMVRLLRHGGGVGVVLPASIYNDSGAGPLRRLLLTQCDLQWLFSFENRMKIFPIDSRFRFCCLIARRGGPTTFVRLAFGRRELAEWVDAERFTIQVARSDLHLFSPISSAVPEVESMSDLQLLRTIFENGVVLGGVAAADWGLKYTREYDMTAGRRAGDYVIAEGVLRDAEEVATACWRLREQLYVPFYTGKMIAQFDYCLQRWVSGHGKQSRWELLSFPEKLWHPEFVSPHAKVRHRWMGGTRLVFRDISIATNERTMLAAVIPAWPCGNKLPIFAEESRVQVGRQLALCCVLNSFVYDFVVRNRMTGINLNKFILDETPVPDLETIPVELTLIGARLCLVHDVFSNAWLELLEACPELGDRPWKSHWAIDPADRLELRAISEAIVAHLYGLNEQQFRCILANCDYPKDQLAELAFRTQLPSKGFWRTGIGSAEHPWRQAWTCDPEFRLTNLAIVAFVELDRLKASVGENLVTAVRKFAPINRMGGWVLPDRIRLRDYGLGQDQRAEEMQELKPCLNRKFPVQIPSEQSWGDCRFIAEELKSLWPVGAQEASRTETLSKRRERRGRRDPGASQPELFRGEE